MASSTAAANLVPWAPKVLAVHAEAKGRTYLPHFERFLDRALAGGWQVVPLGDLLPPDSTALPPARLVRAPVAGRTRCVSGQAGD
ncbi:MAG: hypothetical protein HY721_31765 [Planctomycetes bacterium]|nr:hypothetical protein [Planctomycetota bacterium]